MKTTLIQLVLALVAVVAAYALGIGEGRRRQKRDDKAVFEEKKGIVSIEQLLQRIGNAVRAADAAGVFEVKHYNPDPIEKKWKVVAINRVGEPYPQMYRLMIDIKLRRKQGEEIWANCDLDQGVSFGMMDNDDILALLAMCTQYIKDKTTPADLTGD